MPSNAKAPAHLKGDQLKDCKELIEQGATQKEIDEAYPPPTILPEVPSAMQSAPAPQYVTMEQAMEMAKKAASEAVAEFSANSTSTPAPAAAPVVVRMAPDAVKPDLFDTRNVPAEDFLEGGFTVFHANIGHTFDRFKIAGRLVEPPYSKLIRFKTYVGPETEAYGLAANLVYMCIYQTCSKKEKEMFLADENWGGEFWNSETRSIPEGVQLAMEIMKVGEVVKGMNFMQIKTMAMERLLPTGNLDDMRAAVAAFDANKTIELRRISTAKVENTKKKEDLLERTHA